MKFIFPKGLYCDVRIERRIRTEIRYVLKALEECKVREYSAAFLRVFDGKMWYYSSTTDLKLIQREIDALAALAAPAADIEQNPVIKKMSRLKESKIIYEKNKVSDVGLKEKVKLLDGLLKFVETEPLIKFFQRYYLDTYQLKEFYNSLGAEIKHDYQSCGFYLGFSMTEGDRKFSGSYQLPKSDFSKLSGYEEKLKEKIVRAKDFMLNSEPVEAGKYTVVFAPVATAIFTHECFGHKSEADGMLGDEASKNEWVIGKKIAQDFLTIKDSGLIEGTGYVPYDDEGHPARENYLVKDGKLAGRLHNGRSAADFDEEVTGNARALDYTFEPIVRMTHTYIDKGDKTFEKLISEIETGVYVHDVLHGSGLTTFTIAPSVAYYIKNGKIDKPVRVSVVSGNVFEALANIDGISDEVEQFSSVTGGCGKFAQFPLPVGHGGPYIRVKNMTVQ